LQREMDERQARFSIFRAVDGSSFETVDAMYAEPAAAANLEGWPKLAEAGYHDGHETKLLFAAPGFSLTHVWFKSDLPLPRHSHNVDCLYYVTAGSLKMGANELGPGDGFFVGADTPYTYTPGDRGLELLEFRAADRFSIKFMADNPAFWARAVSTAQQRRERWRSERPPSEAPQPT
jgi:hypothetical protein